MVTRNQWEFDNKFILLHTKKPPAVGGVANRSLVLAAGRNSVRTAWTCARTEPVNLRVCGT